MGTRGRIDSWLRPALLATLLAVAVVAVGCGDDEGTNTAEATTTTEATTFTDTTASISTTAAADTTSSTESTQPVDVPTNERASGSGCTPGTTDSLPDGLWFGFIDDPRADQVSFDLACWFTGAAAVAAAAGDGQESPPPNDFHIRNDSDQLRTLAVDPSTEVAWLRKPGDPETVEVVTYRAWLAEQPGRPVTPGVWLNVEDGQVRSIEEQYVP